MGNRLSKIYTRTGDDGSTGLGDGSRIAKDDPRMITIGSIDELNSHIGVLLASLTKDDKLVNDLAEIQHDLFDIGGELSIPGYTALPEQRVEQLEDLLDRLNSDLPPLKNFILPGGSLAAAHCHVARAVCRRAERDLVHLARETEVNLGARHYINRLSDLLFVMARIIARQDLGSEVLWNRERFKAAE